MILSTKFPILRDNYRRIIITWNCKCCVRCKSTSNTNIKSYSHTIILPKTDFPSRTNIAIKNEMEKTAQFSELYAWQRQEIKSDKEFVLHDGPPYANGDLHMGHAVNKIIKDICNRSQVLRGRKVHFVPGWDCHGLPIELKALQKAKSSSKFETSDPVNIRNIARNFALETIEKQRDSFKKWGVMADWDNKLYLTMDIGYVRNQLMQFCSMHKNGLIFRALKPVYWSPSSKTALAEAELEYDPAYKSKEVYVRFPIVDLPSNIKQIVKSKHIYALIWTTTPWTLVANRGICYNSQMTYNLVTFLGQSDDTAYIVAQNLIDALQKTLHVEIVKLSEFSGEELNGCTYKNILIDRVCPFLESDHVTDAKGTGLVHMAPAHGPDDFLVALKNKMAVECNVDENGRYIDLDPSLDGLYVLEEGQTAVIQKLGDNVLHQGWYTHSYPLDWRTKRPVILRASQQWFIDTASLKTRALEALDSVRILPRAGSEQYRLGLRAQLERRPYWCISRQRAWGAPVPALYADDRPVVDERIVKRLCDLMNKEGPDVWWTCDVTDLLTYDVIEDLGLHNKKLTKGKDILDIWLDSGLSWSTVLDGKIADVYVEGVDQFTGWFQSSLLTSVAIRNIAPYRSILVHGFVVDDSKRKMSKSVGNIMDPLEVVYGGKNKSQPAYGVDTLRWWVASHGTQHTQIVISNKLLEDSQSEVVRIRNVLKYLLSVIADLEKEKFSTSPTLNFLDKYMVKETHNFDRNIKELYENFKYNHVTQSINYFVSNKVSGLYCHCVKDRLYCSSRNSNERLSSQLVVHTILTILSKALGPILPHLIEEVWHYHPLREAPFFFTKSIPILPDNSVDTAMMDLVLDIKSQLHGVARHETLRKFNVNIQCGGDIFEKLSILNTIGAPHESVLCEILEVSCVSLKNGGHIKEGEWRLEVSESAQAQCLRCRKYSALENNDKCARCEYVLTN